MQLVLKVRRVQLDKQVLLEQMELMELKLTLAQQALMESMEVKEMQD